MKQIGFVHFCENCKNRFSSGFNFQQKCECGGRLQSAGPLWLGNLWDSALINEMIAMQETLGWGAKHTKFLQLLIDESKINVPYYFEVSEFAKVEPKTSAVIETLQKKGFAVSQTHFSEKGIRTNAPISHLREIFQH
jgi:tRNA (guanine26-N2/guanine27-N2)-dimethyltransferase